MKKRGYRSRTSSSRSNTYYQPISPPKILTVSFIIIFGLGVIWSGLLAPVEYDVTLTQIESEQADTSVPLETLDYRDSYTVSHTLEMESNTASVPFWLVTNDLDETIIQTDSGTYIVELDQPVSFQPIIFIISLLGFLMFTVLHVFISWELKHTI